MLWQCEVLSGDGLQPKFLELEGDFRHLNDVYINTYIEDEGEQTEYNKKVEQLNNLLYKEDGHYKVTFLSEPTKDWDYFIHCGFLP